MACRQNKQAAACCDFCNFNIGDFGLCSSFTVCVKLPRVLRFCGYNADFRGNFSDGTLQTKAAGPRGKIPHLQVAAEAQYGYLSSASTGNVPEFYVDLSACRAELRFVRDALFCVNTRD